MDNKDKLELRKAVQPSMQHNCETRHTCDFNGEAACCGIVTGVYGKKHDGCYSSTGQKGHTLCRRQDLENFVATGEGYKAWGTYGKAAPEAKPSCRVTAGAVPLLSVAWGKAGDHVTTAVINPGSVGTT